MSPRQRKIKIDKGQMNVEYQSEIRACDSGVANSP